MKDFNTVGLFYAQSQGRSEESALAIVQAFNENCIKLISVEGCAQDEMQNYSKLIIGVQSYENGELQDDWEAYLPHMLNIDFTSKIVSFFGLDDQYKYADTFLDAMGTLYEVVIQGGGTVVGSWPTDTYRFDTSKAVVQNEFIGLALDDVNQYEQSKERINAWVEQIRPYYIP